MPPQIFLSSAVVPDSRATQFRIDVNARNLPQHFLGLGFDLMVPVDWQFDHVEQCGVFDFGDSNIFHLVSEQRELHQNAPANGTVFGLAVLKNGDESFENGPDNGCVASFYFHAQGGGSAPERGTNDQNGQKIYFEHPVMSIFSNGRHDVTNVDWQGTVLNPTSGLYKVGQTQQISQETSSQRAFTQQTLLFPGDLGTSTMYSGQSLDSGVIDVYEVILFGLFVISAVFMMVLIYFRLFKKPQRKPPSEREP